MYDFRIQDCAYFGEEVGMTGEGKWAEGCMDVGNVPVLAMGSDSWVYSFYENSP